MESIEALKLAEHVRATRRKAECAARLANLAESYQRCVLGAPKEPSDAPIDPRLAGECRARLAACQAAAPVDPAACAGLPDLQASMRERCQRVQRPVSAPEVQAALDQSFVRRVAGCADLPPSLVREYADLLSIAVRNVGTWDWPEVKHRLDYFPWQGRCRQVVELDVVTCLFLHVVGERWQHELKGALLELAPAAKDRKHKKPRAKSELESWTLSVQRGPLFLAALGEEYGAASAPERVEWVPNVIAVRRRADSDLEVCQGDVANLSNTLSHELVQQATAKLGLPQCWRDFVATFCRYPLEGGGRAQRGVPGFQALSILLGELCLHAVDQLAFRESDVWPLRFHDDYYWLGAPGTAAKAHQAWASALQKCGLAPNAAKAGRLSSDSEDDAVMVAPEEGEGPVTWNLLALGPSGWAVDARAVERRAALLDAALATAPTTLDKVRVHNAHLKALDDGLGKATSALGVHHAREAVACLEAQIARTGLAKALAAETGAEEAWVRWPSGWGGLGLRGGEQRAADSRGIADFQLPERKAPEPVAAPPVPVEAPAQMVQLTQYLHQLQHADANGRSEKRAAAEHAIALRRACDAAVRPRVCQLQVQLDVVRPRAWADLGEQLRAHFGTTTLVPPELIPRLLCRRFGCA